MSTSQMKFWNSHTSYHQFLRAQCILPRITADNHQHYSTHRQEATMSHSGYSSCQVSGMYHVNYFDFAARRSHSFHFPTFNISVPNPMASYPSTTAHSLDIQMLVIAQHSPFTPPIPIFTRGFLCRYHYIAVTRYPISGEEMLSILRQLPRCDGMRAMDILISGKSRQDGWMDGYRRSSRAPSCSHQGRCLVEEGGYCYGLRLALPTGVAYLRCQLLAALLLISILDIYLKPLTATTGPKHLE